MEKPKNTEELTKLLRSKDITTTKIVEVVSSLKDLDFEFPNAEVFILELIQDRWNDHKLVEFKRDYKIWKLFNELWSRLQNTSLKKRMFRSLKFVPLLLQTLDLTNLDRVPFLKELRQLCFAINSTVTIDIPTESTFKILGGILNLISSIPSTDLNKNGESELIYEIINLTNIENTPLVNPKLATSYCSYLLVPTLEYLNKFGDTIDPLTRYMKIFLFDEHLDPTKLLAKFIKDNKEQLKPELAALLFQKSISFLASNNFQQLEKIYTLVIDIDPKLAPTLLKELSLSKKTLSQPFLENLLDSQLSLCSTANSYDLPFWSLLSHIIDLDIEVGIKYVQTLLDLIYTQTTLNPKETSTIYKKIVHCYVNARELLDFINLLQVYCEKNTDYSKLFLVNPNFTEIISRNISALSVKQMLLLFNGLLDSLSANGSNEIAFLSLKVCLEGLPRLTYTILPDLKDDLSKIFELNLPDVMKQYELRYLIMEVYDDIIPEKVLEDLSSMENLENLLSSIESRREIFFYFFKLREYKEFDISPVTSKFKSFLNSSDPVATRLILHALFTNWSSLVNVAFTTDDIEELVKLLVFKDNLELLNHLLTNDDLFEEENIMRAIIDQLSSTPDIETTIPYLSKIPIQCFDKKTRIKLLDQISMQRRITENDMHMLFHLLESPTFRSTIESDVTSLYSLMSQDINRLTFTNKVFERIWNNHILQLKEDTSVSFIQNMLATVSENLKSSNDFDMVYFQMAFLILSNNKNNIDLKNLYDVFFLSAFNKINKILDHSDKIPYLSWLIKCLYYILKDNDRCNEFKEPAHILISTLMENSKVKLVEMDQELLGNTFLLFSIFFDEKLEIIFAQYMVLRNKGIDKDTILPGIGNAVTNALSTGPTSDFNTAFSNTIYAFADKDSVFAESILEIYLVQLEKLSKENTVGKHLFVKSILEFYTNIANFVPYKDAIISVLATIENLLVSKPWIFSQYCIEQLFPLSISLLAHTTAVETTDKNDALFTATLKVLSTVLFVHRVKLTQRHHLVISTLCQYLEIISCSQDLELSAESAKLLSRFITNFCEPSSTSISQNNDGKDKLTSKINVIKQSLRKHMPIVLIKYIYLSIGSPFEDSIRKELIQSIFSIFNLLSPVELNLVNAMLDNAGNQFFKTLYADYKKKGKWTEN
ncbi:ribosome biogenesis protein URB2 NDAI_0G04790 [Naumovozyma dairenensis CBS 421]|uniref:Nucleolar 27S pre-rRNA processing Urb2/Npa2 C-terminal domain-containing protein n=1 Tax=Naumovozyma dairenensis (strain ATCC 10597 / BCRC 20456 / CBS 421 / NBRC 0211 / NRRL Y-12639) TaxID=1071378 RepID=J7RTB9_NAUDC|nr:hypothetical protein NDAI_0G04790 [Naumovozyma dairenensis CBS 421]CCK73462.1 hypothetical protein NDAI_0G04790 [Naumovozyma dairenensis CBS 421]